RHDTKNSAVERSELNLGHKRTRLPTVNGNPISWGTSQRVTGSMLALAACPRPPSELLSARNGQPCGRLYVLHEQLRRHHAAPSAVRRVQNGSLQLSDPWRHESWLHDVSRLSCDVLWCCPPNRRSRSGLRPTSKRPWPQQFHPNLDERRLPASCPECSGTC